MIRAWIYFFFSIPSSTTPLIQLTMHCMTQMKAGYLFPGH